MLYTSAPSPLDSLCILPATVFTSSLLFSQQSSSVKGGLLPGNNPKCMIKTLISNLSPERLMWLISPDARALRLHTSQIKINHEMKGSLHAEPAYNILIRAMPSECRWCFFPSWCKVVPSPPASFYLSFSLHPHLCQTFCPMCNDNR